MSDPAPPFEPDPGLVALINALAVGPDSAAVLVGLRPDHSLLRLLTTPGLLLAFRASVLDDPRYRRAVAHSASELGTDHLHIIAVGGGASTESHLREIREHIPRGSVDLAMIDTAGEATRLTRGALPSCSSACRASCRVTDDGGAYGDRGSRDGGNRIHGDPTPSSDETGSSAARALALAIVVVVGLVEWSLGAFGQDGVYLHGGHAVFGTTWASWTLLPCLRSWRSDPRHERICALDLGGQLERIVGGGRVSRFPQVPSAVDSPRPSSAMRSPSVIGRDLGTLVAQGWLGSPEDSCPERDIVVRKNARNLVINLLISFVPGIAGDISVVDSAVWSRRQWDCCGRRGSGDVDVQFNIGSD